MSRFDTEDFDWEDEGYDACIVCNALAQDPESCQTCGRPLCFMCYEGGAAFCGRKDCCSNETLTRWLRRYGRREDETRYPPARAAFYRRYRLQRSGLDPDDPDHIPF